MFSYLFLFYSVIFCFSSKSLFLVWVCFEFNMLVYVSLTENFSNFMSVAMMKYFMIQSISSSLFLFFCLLKYFYFCSVIEEVFKFLVIISMWVKLGFFPFSSWYYQVSENMSWGMWFFLNTVQKIMPLFVVCLHLYMVSFFIILLLMNSVYSLLEIFNQMSMRWMVNSSSLNHFSWMMISMFSNFSGWELYYFVYMFLNMILFMFMFYYNWGGLMSVFMNNSFLGLMIFMLIFFNFLGVPPFLGFFSKVLVLIISDLFFMLMFLLFVTVVFSVVYLNFMMGGLMVILKSNMVFGNEKVFFTIFFLSIFLFLQVVYIL